MAKELRSLRYEGNLVSPSGLGLDPAIKVIHLIVYQINMKCRFSPVAESPLPTHRNIALVGQLNDRLKSTRHVFHQQVSQLLSFTNLQIKAERNFAHSSQMPIEHVCRWESAQKWR